MPGDHDADKLRVLQATPIERLIGEHLTLRPKGRELVGLCPFHDDRTPSMHVAPAKQLFKCFACGAGGDVFTFVMDYHQMTFREALAFLADRAGIKLTPWRGRAATEDAGPAVPRAQLVEANQFAAAYFRAILKHPEHGVEARRVIDRRGISPEVVERFGLGAAADKWDGLALTVARKELPVEPFIAAGLLRRRDQGAGVYDVFRNRLMFPITDQLGRVIAFGARRINDADEPKYLNSADSPVFSKSGTLYALPLAVPAIRKESRAIVTEGYMDTIACHQAGVTSAVATLGTALTPAHAKVLSRLGKAIVLLFDGDDAGQRAADRAVEVLFAAPVDVKIATLSTLKGVTAKDPDELLRQPDGRARFAELLEVAQDALTYRFERFRASLRGMGTRVKAELLEKELSRLVELGLNSLTPSTREQILRNLQTVSGVSIDDLRRQVAAATPAVHASNSASARAVPLPKASSPAQRVLAFLLSEPSLSREMSDEQRVAILSPAMIAHPLLEKVAKTLDSMVNLGNATTTQSIVAALDDPEERAAVASLVTDLSRMGSPEPDNVRRAFHAELARAWHDALLAQARETDDRELKFRLTRQAKQALGGAAPTP